MYPYVYSQSTGTLVPAFLPPSHANVCECASKCLKVEDSRLPVSFKIVFTTYHLSYNRYMSLISIYTLCIYIYIDIINHIH